MGCGANQLPLPLQTSKRSAISIQFRSSTAKSSLIHAFPKVSFAAALHTGYRLLGPF
jgi:hypothetical protein